MKPVTDVIKQFYEQCNQLISLYINKYWHSWKPNRCGETERDPK